MSDKTSTITRYVCPECGGFETWRMFGPECHRYRDHAQSEDGYARSVKCEPRKYVAVDALLSDEATDAAEDAIMDAIPEGHSTGVSGQHLFCVGVEAARAALTGEQPPTPEVCSYCGHAEDEHDAHDDTRACHVAECQCMAYRPALNEKEV